MSEDAQLTIEDINKIVKNYATAHAKAWNDYSKNRGLVSRNNNTVPITILDPDVVHKSILISDKNSR